MKITILITSLITILSKAIGFFRNIFLSYYYGIGNITDSYMIASSIPRVIFAMIGVSISTTFIPLLTKAREANSESGFDFSNNVITVFSMLSTCIVIVVILFTEEVVLLFAPGFSEELIKNTVIFTRITVFSVYGYVILSVFKGFLNVNESFVSTSLLGIPLNIVIIISIYLSTKISIYLLPIGVLISVYIQILCLIPVLKKFKYKFSLTLNLKDTELKSLFIMSIPVLIGVSLDQINAIIDKNIASNISIGGISALTYSFELTQCVIGIFVMVMMTVVYPNLARSFVRGKDDEFKTLTRESINFANLFMIPATLGILVFSEQIITLLYSRGEFVYENMIVTSNTLFYYSFGLMGFGAREILTRAFYAMNDTKTPLFNAGIGVVINIILNLILSRYLGINGLALATSISAIITASLMYISLYKKIGSLDERQIFIMFLKILCASIITILISMKIYNCFVTVMVYNVSFVFAIIIGLVFYLFIVYIMNINNFRMCIQEIIMKKKKK